MASKQITSHVMMVRPAHFGFNPETALDNAFQLQPNKEESIIQESARKEFDQFLALLLSHQISVTVVDDLKTAVTTDSVFPNNWVSFHENGFVCLYPMLSLNRRKERRLDILDMLKSKFSIERIVDLSHFEAEDKFLEGTGSMVLDRPNGISYLCIAKRTDLLVFNEFSKKQVLGSSNKCNAIIFEAVDKNGQPIYHTNVVMCLGQDFVVICLEAIKDALQKDSLISSFKTTGKAIVEISMEQMYNFAGNMLQLCNDKGDKFLVMSTRAFQSLTPIQINTLETFNQKLLHTDLSTIENHGGGSARCMIAEIFLPLL